MKNQDLSTTVLNGSRWGFSRPSEMPPDHGASQNSLHRSDPITQQLVAKKIIAVARLGIEDPAEISKVALKELGS
jgi:hypothetical protein